jgi:RNA recognition motif-containing protein
MARIYVGNLPTSANEATVRDLFALHGVVETVSLISDLVTGKPRGFGYVEMPTNDAAMAVAALNGRDLGGRSLEVNPAQDRASVSSISQWRGR